MATKISGIILVLVIGLAILVFSCSVVTGLNQTVTVVHLYGQIAQDPSYTVWTKGGVYYANDTFGAIAYSSPVASNVLNYAFSALTNGGHIFVKEGLYGIATTLNLINPNIVLEGESWNTVFRLSNAVNNKLITVSGNNCTIRNIQLDGNYAGQSSSYSNCILVYFANNTMIDHIYGHDSWDECIDFQGSTGGWFINSQINHTRGDGFVAYGSKNLVVDNNIVTNSGIVGVKAANNLWFSSSSNCTASNLILDTASDSNFEIQGGGVSETASSHGVTAVNITCFNATLVGIYIDGQNTTYKNYDSRISDFQIYNSHGIGLQIANYVENSKVGNGTIDTTGGYGVYLGCEVTNVNVHDIIINNTAGNGAQMTTKVTNSTFSKITVIGAQGINGGIVIASVNSANAPNRLLDCAVSNSASDDYYIYQAEGTIISRSTSTNAGGNGMIVVNSNYVQLLDNTVRTPDNDGIKMTTDQYPTVTGNSIFDLGSGMHGIQPSAVSLGLFSNNYIFCTTATNRIGFEFYLATNCTVSNNYIWNLGTGVFLDNSNVAGTLIFGNTIINATTPIIDSGVSTSIYNNTGYNPIGIITNPFDGNNHILLDLGGNNATWSSATTYTNWESPKIVYISSGTVTAVVQNGQTIFSNSECTVILQPADTFSIIFSSAPIIKVEGR